MSVLISLLLENILNFKMIILFALFQIEMLIHIQHPKQYS